MEINNESVDAHFKLMSEPEKYGLPFRPLTDCFELSEDATAQHILFAGYQTEVPQIQKVFFYIVMEQVFGPALWKDANGDLGFKLKFKAKE